MRNHSDYLNLKYILPIIALAVSFTSLYGVAYILALIIGLKYFNFTKTFNSIFSRMIIGFLILAATVMFVGLFSWMVGVETFATSVIIGFFSILLILSRYSNKGAEARKLLDKGDLIGIFLASIAPLVVFFSFYFPNPSNVASYRFAIGGWDNTSHALLFVTTDDADGYVYGSYDDVKSQTITPLNAYPQAWHLASTHLANSINIDFFNQEKPLQLLNSYLVVLFLWAGVGIFIFSKLALRLQSIFSKDRRMTFTALTTFLFLSIAVQLLVYWPALVSGYGNYLATITYTLLMIAAITDNNLAERERNYVLALVSGGAAALCWFLPLPAIAIVLLLSFFTATNRTWTKPFKRTDFSLLPLLSLTGLIVIAVLAQLAIFVIYSTVEGADQLNTGNLGGVFTPNPLLLLFVSLYTFYYLYNKSSYQLTSQYIQTLGVFVLFTFLIYIYQLSTSSELSYYFGKILVITMAVAGVYFVGSFTSQISEYSSAKKESINSLILAMSTLALIFMGSGQSLQSFEKLLERNSIVTEKTAEATVDYLNNYDPNKTKLVILRDESLREDYNGNLAGKLPHLPLTCAYSVVDGASSKSVSLKLQNLDKCAHQLDKDLVVITSNSTLPLVREIQQKHNNIKVINIP